MDYVLFGMGYGATLMLIGWALRTFGPSLKYANAEDSTDVDAQVKRRFWVRFIQGAGGIIAIAGTAFVFVTFVVMLINPDDETGSLTSYVVWGFLIVSLLAWCWLYFGRFGITGIWCKEEGYGLLGNSGGTRREKPMSRVTSRTTAPLVVPAESDGAKEAPSSEVADEESPNDETTAEPGETDAEEADSAENTSRDYDFGDANNASVFASRTAALRRLREKQQATAEPSTDDVIETSENTGDSGNSGTS